MSSSWPMCSQDDSLKKMLEQISTGTRSAREWAVPAVGVREHGSRPAKREWERHH